MDLIKAMVTHVVQFLHSFGSYFRRAVAYLNAL